MASKNEKYSKMEANDAIIAAGIGGGVAVYFYYILGQSSGGLIAESFVRWRWLLLIIFPLLADLGLQIAFLIGKKFPAIYQLAKFLLVGAMAAILDLALLNLFMILSGAASGAGCRSAQNHKEVKQGQIKYRGHRSHQQKFGQLVNCRKLFADQKRNLQAEIRKQRKNDQQKPSPSDETFRYQAARRLSQNIIKINRHAAADTRGNDCVICLHF